MFRGPLLAAAALLVPALPVVAECIPSPTVLCIDEDAGDRRFEVSVTYSTVQAGGRSGNAGAVPLTPRMPEAGLFTFFHDGNPEVLVKILDGCVVNLHFWVLYSAATNVGFTIRVEDHERGTVWFHGNADLEPALSVQDTRALPCVGVRSGG